MAILKNGLFGGYSGKVDKLVGYELNGQQVIRSKANPSTKPPSIKQLNNRQQMAVICKFLNIMDEFTRAGFGPKAKGTTKNFHNLAVEYNKPQALSGFYPEVTVNYAKVLLSKGNLAQAINPAAVWVEEGLKFTWENYGRLSWPETEEQVMLLAYNADKNIHFYTISGAKRTKGWDLLEIPASLKNERFELYISFISHDRLDVADSQYIGFIEG